MPQYLISEDDLSRLTLQVRVSLHLKENQLALHFAISVQTRYHLLPDIAAFCEANGLTEAYLKRMRPAIQLIWIYRSTRRDTDQIVGGGIKSHPSGVHRSIQKLGGNAPPGKPSYSRDASKVARPARKIC